MDRQQMLDYIAATTQLYGVIPYEEVAEIYTEQTGDRVNAEQVRMLAQDSEEEMGLVRAESEFLAHDTVMQDNKADLYFEATKGKAFYVPKAEELLRYRDDNYVEMTAQARALEKFAKGRLGFNEGEVSDLHKSIRSAANEPEGDAFQNLIAALRSGNDTEKLDPDDFENLMRYAAHMYNHIRSWTHRGHTPYEMGEEILLGMPRPELEGDVQEKVDYILALTHLWGIAPRHEGPGDLQSAKRHRTCGL